MQYRKLRNGDIITPHRGRPPACPDGYIRDAGDAFVFHPILESCPSRGEKAIQHKCCRQPKITMWCTHFDKIITPMDCMECSYVSKSGNDNLPKVTTTEVNITFDPKSSP